MNVEKVSKALFIAGPLHQKGQNSGHFIGQCLYCLISLLQHSYFNNTVENKKDKIIPTLRVTLISCYCQETHKYKQ